VFQRSPSWVVPKPDRPYRPRQRQLFRALPWLQAISRWLVYWRFEMLILALTSAQWIAAPYRIGYRRRLEKEIPDPELREKLLPDFPLGCKRVLISNDYLPMLARPNVDLVTEPIAEVRADRVVAGDGEQYEVDTIILGTGFTANDFLAPMTIRGMGGRDLDDVWRERGGAEAYLGLVVNGFPNMFMLYGPNTNLGAGSIIFMLESQIEFVVAAVQTLIQTGARWMDVHDEVQEAFNREVQERLKGTVWTAGCQSWYRTESGKVVNNWPGLTFEYRRRTRRPDPVDFRLVGTGQAAESGARAA
jgi:cation diffusion facilitator CzcD-associated flavoprotein CzcO